MSKMNKFDDALNECLNRLFKGETIESCLALFPEYAAELEPLLHTALETRRAARILPRPEFRQRAAYEFQAAIRDITPPKHFSFKWQVRLVTVLSVIVVLLMAGTGTVAAANNSLPDQPLYNVKLIVEDARVALTPSPVAKAELNAHYADVRVNEIIKMADKGNVALVEKTTQRMNENIQAITRFAQPAKATDAVSDEPAILLSSATAGEPPQPETSATIPLKTAPPTPTDESSPGSHVPVPSANITAPGLQRSTSTTANHTTPGGSISNHTPTVAQKSVAATPPANTLSTANNTRSFNISKTDNITRKDGQAQLQITVSQQALKNTEDLQQVIDRSPESVKEALKKALATANKGYDEALKNLDKNKK